MAHEADQRRAKVVVTVDLRPHINHDVQSKLRLSAADGCASRSQRCSAELEQGCRLEKLIQS